jgi:putative DNA primase/helicase
MDASGLAIEKTCSKGVTKQTEIHWIAAPFEVLGACRDPQGSAWGKMLRWRDPDGRAHIQHVANADLHGEPAALCAGLEHHGLHIERARQRDFVSYLSSVPVKRRAAVVSRTGWHEIGRRSVFVLPGETIGPRGGERVILDAAAHGPYEARGTIEDWRDAPAKLASGHVLPVLAISAALAGPLLHLAGIEGGGVHFFGPSSKGKTTLLHLAGSVWGRGGTPGYVHAWRATANGLEGAAVGATDAALILDELGQVEAREFAAAVYSLANGAGKSRAGRDGGLREPKSWRVIFLSSGEIPIDTKLAEDRGRRARAGQLIRLLDIPVSRAFGAFDLAGSDGDAAALAKACKLAAVSAYGTAGPDFVRRLISEGVTGDGVRALVNDFVRAKVPARADGQIDRAAQRLGLIATAGEMATALGVTDWRPGEAREAAAWALAKWIEGRGGTGPAEVRQAIEQVRHFIDVHGDTRFDNLDDLGARPVPNRAGWRKGAGEDRRWMFASEVWKLDVCAGLDAKFVASVLADRSMLEKGGDGNLKVARIAGRSQRVYVVTPQILDGAGQ